MTGNHQHNNFKLQFSIWLKNNMATDMTAYDRFGFYSGWFGVAWCMMVFILLFSKAKEQNAKMRRGRCTLTSNPEKLSHLKQDIIASLIFSFACAWFTLLYCRFYEHLVQILVYH